MGPKEPGSSNFVERDGIFNKEEENICEFLPINRTRENYEDELGFAKEIENKGIKEVGSLNFVERDDICEKIEENRDSILSQETFEYNDSIEKRLLELLLGTKEPELSEEVLRMNDQLQEDELVAMKSIYGDNVRIFGKQRGLRYFQIHVNLEAPEEFKISAKLSSHTDLKADNTNLSDELLYSFQVQYLPPIILTCLLPKSYPSHLPPLFTISVQWLDSEKISKFCSMLDSIWEEQKGQEVIYRWVDWLHNSCLSYLGFDSEIVLGPYGLKNDRDRRAISCSVSDVDIDLLKSYNDEQCHERFFKNFQECCICYSEYPGSDFIRLTCQHFFCSKCIKTYSDVHVKEGTLSKLVCPETECGSMIPPGVLKQLLGDNAFQRWESLMLQKTLDSMSDVVYCPRCEMACIEEEEYDAQCSKCFFSFCTLCKERRHLGVTCMNLDMKLVILQERQNYSQIRDEHKRIEREMINEIISLKQILGDAKQCPSCKMGIVRVGDGCNKMVFRNCGNIFCYRCNRSITGYGHFSGGECRLFPREQHLPWNGLTYYSDDGEE